MFEVRPKISHLHESSLRAMVRSWLRAVRRWPAPLLTTLSSSNVAASGVPPPYSSADEAKREFARHAKIAFDVPELDRRVLLLAGLAGSAPSAGAQVVFDLGGSTGFHRAQIAPVLEGASALEWVVVETEAFCAAAAKRDVPGVSFFASIAAALQDGKAPSCVYSNSGLQYLADPLATLAQVIDAGAAGVVLERVPFCLGEQTIHCEQPVTHLSGERGAARMAIAPVTQVQRCLEEAGFQVALYCTRRAAFRHGLELIDLYSLVAIRSRKPRMSV